MNNIDRCKKAQELGLRVLYRDYVFTGPWDFDDRAEHYSIHPDDEKAFENFLALEAKCTQFATVAFQKGVELLQVKDQIKKQADGLAELFADRNELNELRKQRAASTDDLLLQLRSKLGPLDTIAIVIHGA